MSNDKAAATFYPHAGRTYRWTIGIDVPWATEVISMNARSHWTNTHRQISALRARGSIMARAQPTMPNYLTATVQVFIRFPDKRRRDIENYHKTFKSIIDGFVDAGLLPDDDSRHLTRWTECLWIPGEDENVDSHMIIGDAARRSLSLVFVFEGMPR